MDTSPEERSKIFFKLMCFYFKHVVIGNDIYSTSVPMTALEIRPIRSAAHLQANIRSDQPINTCLALGSILFKVICISTTLRDMIKTHNENKKLVR